MIENKKQVDTGNKAMSITKAQTEVLKTMSTGARINYGTRQLRLVKGENVQEFGKVSQSTVDAFANNGLIRVEGYSWVLTTEGINIANN